MASSLPQEKRWKKLQINFFRHMAKPFRVNIELEYFFATGCEFEAEVEISLFLHHEDNF